MKNTETLIEFIETYLPDYILRVYNKEAMEDINFSLSEFCLDNFKESLEEYTKLVWYKACNKQKENCTNAIIKFPYQFNIVKNTKIPDIEL